MPDLPLLNWRENIGDLSEDEAMNVLVAWKTRLSSAIPHYESNLSFMKNDLIVTKDRIHLLKTPRYTHQMSEMTSKLQDLLFTIAEDGTGKLDPEIAVGSALFHTARQFCSNEVSSGIP